MSQQLLLFSYTEKAKPENVKTIVKTTVNNLVNNLVELERKDRKMESLLSFF